MSSSFTIQLPAGTNITKLINLPQAGGWLGSVICGIATHTTDASIHEWMFINEWIPSQPTKKGYRHVDYAGNMGAGFDNWTLVKDVRCYKVLFTGESMMKIRYTSTNEISVNVETTHTQYISNAYPLGDGNCLYLLDGRIVWVNK